MHTEQRQMKCAERLRVVRILRADYIRRVRRRRPLTIERARPNESRFLSCRMPFSFVGKEARVSSVVSATCTNRALIVTNGSLGFIGMHAKSKKNIVSAPLGKCVVDFGRKEWFVARLPSRTDETANGQQEARVVRRRVDGLLVVRVCREEAIA